MIARSCFLDLVPIVMSCKDLVTIFLLKNHVEVIWRTLSQHEENNIFHIVLYFFSSFKELIHCDELGLSNSPLVIHVVLVSSQEL